MEHQLAPQGDWRTWIIMGGRGAGKTRAGAEWVRSQVEGAGPKDAGRCRRLALVGETVDQVREVMIFGESGILACSPPDRRPEWQAGRGQLGSSGVVKNDTMRRTILKNFEQWSKRYFVIVDKADSEVAGEHGNRERFYHLRVLD